jgi:hypothetical protein
LTHEHAAARAGRRFTWRFAFGIGWILVAAIASFGALVNRPAFAGTQAFASIFLVLFGIPAVVLAIAAIRPAGLLVATAVLSGAVSALGAWSTMRDTSSTAAIGVITTPFAATLIVVIGCAVSGFSMPGARRRRREAVVVSALAALTLDEPEPE